MKSPVPVLCPICFEPLARSGRSYVCQQRHNFDLSKEGYLSLLHGRANYQEIGDDRTMVLDRIRVHQLPPYLDLAKAIAAISLPTAGGILDIGCGDGFFLDHVSGVAGAMCSGIGIDISKGALAKAAKGFPNLQFIRTDAAHSRLPFRDSSFGLVLSIFAPRPWEEIRRVLDTGGRWLIVTAAPDHLEELRLFLPLAAIGTGKLDAPTSGAFSVVRSTSSRSKLNVAHDDLVSIVGMSPSIHRLRRDHGEVWPALVPPELRVTFSFSLTLLCNTT